MNATSSKYWRLKGALARLRSLRGAHKEQGQQFPVADSDHHTYRVIKGSGLFDEEWYLNRYPDARDNRADPLQHYLQFGVMERRDPSPDFSTDHYLKANPDVAGAGLNPLYHYIVYGISEGCSTAPSEGYVPTSTSACATDKEFLLDAMRVPANAAKREVTRYSPLISLVLPTFNTPERFLREVIASIQHQSYDHWELLVVDDASTDARCREVLAEVAASDARIKASYSTNNAGIAVTSQIALEKCAGEFVGFVDHDDILTPAALSHVVEYLRAHPDVDVVYSDHAMLSDNGEPFGPGLKPSWSPEFFLSTNYLVHFVVCRRSFLEQIGGFKSTQSLIQDVGLYLKLLYGKAKFGHLQKVLYFWRTHAISVAQSTHSKPTLAQMHAALLDDYLRKCGVDAKTEWPDRFKQSGHGVFKLCFPNPPKLHSAIIIPVWEAGYDASRIVNRVAESLPTSRPEIHLVGVDVRLPDKQPEGVFVHEVSSHVNFSDLLAKLSAEALVFIRSSTVYFTEGWLSELVGYLMVDEAIGAVGGKILGPTLRVEDGATLLLPGLPVFCKGLSDHDGGPWLRNQLASNVEAVSCALLATRRSVCLKVGGLPLHDYGADAGIAYCLRLREHGYRIVYNPWARTISSQKTQADELLESRLRAEFHSNARIDRYYNENFDKRSLFQLAKKRR